MTGYATAEKVTGELSVYVEIHSYNSKYLDVALRLPRAFTFLEDKIKGVFSEHISRGRLEVKIEVNRNANDAYTFEVNKPKAEAYHKVLTQLKEDFRISSEIPLDLFLSAGEIIRPVEVEAETESCWPFIRECITTAVRSLDEMRSEEGRFLEKDFRTRLDDMEKKIDHIERESASLLPYYQERLKERIAALTKGLIEIDQNRITQEAAFLADRSDISEEIVRSRSHIKQFRAIMDSDEASGRKLNFLLQEFNREFNTMGSKIGSADISHRVVELKSELEKMREQVQNVE